MDSSVPLYAILSHTWGEDEVTFQDINAAGFESKLGYEKISKTCSLAATQGFGYVWIDTCCIDKTSSAELSEAINSMYRWYGDAAICYAYLSDVECCDANMIRSLGWSSDFCSSRWFTRGWTLQELIAPQIVLFLSRDWKEIGTKSTLAITISISTGIPSEILLGSGLHDFSVAQKFSWASRRETSRIEDRAYSLMGIFRVNMPLLYGEGARAFRRLQEEILKITDDYSIFAWRSSQPSTSGLLATSPDAFYHSYNVVPDYWLFSLRDSITLNNKGVHLRARLVEAGHPLAIELAILPCKLKGQDERVAIHVQRVSGPAHHFHRANSERFELIATEQVKEATERGICIEFGRQARSSWQPLARAAADGDGNVFRALLEQGARQCDSTFYGLSPLANAVRHGHEDIVKAILTHDSGVTSIPHTEIHPLTRSISLGHTSITELLLRHGVVPGPIALDFSRGQAAIKNALLKFHLDAIAADGQLILKAEQNQLRCIFDTLLQEGGQVINYHLFDEENSPTPKTEVAGMDRFSFSRAEPKTACHSTSQTFFRDSEHPGTVDEPFVSLIMASSMKLECKDRHGCTPLAWAAARGYEHIAKTLIAWGADTNDRDNLEAAPITLAATAGHEKLVRLLLDHGAEINSSHDVGQTPLLSAMREGHTAVVDHLLERGARVNDKDRSGTTPLIWAARNGDATIVKTLLQMKANIEAEDGPGCSPLYWALKEGHSMIVKLLLENGADLSRTVVIGRTPLIWAAQKGHGTTVMVLLEHGADIHSKDMGGCTALIHAAREGRTAVAEFLLSAGALPDAQSYFGNTALKEGIRTRNQPLVSLLLEKGALSETNADENEHNLLQLAMDNYASDVVEMLLQKCNNWDPRCDLGVKLLTTAAKHISLDVARLLLERGVAPPSVDGWGDTLLDMAALDGDEDMVELLLEKGAAPLARDVWEQSDLDDDLEPETRQLMTKDLPKSKKRKRGRSSENGIEKRVRRKTSTEEPEMPDEEDPRGSETAEPPETGTLPED